MALFRITRTGAAPPTGLAGGVSAAALSFSLTNASGYPTGTGGPFVLVLDPGTPLEEKVLCSSLSGVVVTVASSGRGWDGTSAAAHSGGTGNVAHVFTAAEADDANSHIYDYTRDDHSQYSLFNGQRACVTHAFLGADQAIPANAYTTIAYDSLYINNGFPPGSFNPATHVFTVPYAGMYRINAHAGFSTGIPGSATEATGVSITHNATPVSFSPGSSYNPAWTLWVAESTIIRSCAVSDILAAYAYALSPNTARGIPALSFITFEPDRSWFLSIDGTRARC